MLVSFMKGNHKKNSQFTFVEGRGESRAVKVSNSIAGINSENFIHVLFLHIVECQTSAAIFFNHTKLLVLWEKVSLTESVQLAAYYDIPFQIPTSIIKLHLS